MSSSADPAAGNSRALVPWLWILLGLFCFRVLAQLLQWQFELPWLPPFESWHSSVLPYEGLLLAQALILVLLARTALGISTGRAPLSRSAGRLWLALGILYLTVMGIRLILGLTLLSSHYWFANHLPTAFHLVLASFMVIVGLVHGRSTPAGRER